MSKTAELTPTDYIEKTIGNILFVYYLYVDRLHVRPLSLEDLVDGLLYLDSQRFLQKKAMRSAHDT